MCSQAMDMADVLGLAVATSKVHAYRSWKRQLQGLEAAHLAANVVCRCSDVSSISFSSRMQPPPRVRSPWVRTLSSRSCRNLNNVHSSSGVSRALQPIKKLMIPGSQSLRLMRFTYFFKMMQWRLHTDKSCNWYMMMHR